MSNNFKITNEDARVLLKAAREVLTDYILHGKERGFDYPLTEGLEAEAGLFVTLHKKGALRGCIGYIIGREPLWKEVTELVIASAVKDTRFPPVNKSELDEIDIEISILTPPEKITDVNEIEMGVHGVIVKKGFRQGVFLPQVAIETGWDRDKFLSELCSQKAGLSPDAWKKEDLEIFVFKALVFNE